ncbi:MAG: anaerobic ribonucleoside-triphosphate reductase [bacterium]
MNIQEIDEKLAEKRAKLNEVKGTQTEVYSRITGYYRPLSKWNAGKRAEWETRVQYGV